MASRSKSKAEGPRVMIGGEVARRIRQHARGQSKTEVCGVLIGRENEGRLEIDACIAGANAAQAGSHVTFTQDTWEHIYKVKDSEYPDDRIVGWYHSHPGFGVFLSDHDTFIHKNFFSSPQQVAWVYDPHSDEEGCFGWEKEVPRWLDWTFSILSHVLIFVLGAFLAINLVRPKQEVYVLDRITGEVAGPVPYELLEQAVRDARGRMVPGDSRGAAGTAVPPPANGGKEGENGQSGK